jgi:hypothetical protein
VELAEAGEQGLHESLQGLYPDLRRAFAEYMGAHYPQWLRALDGDRPPLSVDMVAEFVVPVLARARKVAFVVIDCLRLDQWAVLAPLLAAEFDVEVTHYFGILPTATPYARNALFSGLFPAELAERHPDWWGDRDDESLNAHERELLVAQLAELGHPVPVRYVKVNTAADADELARRLPGAIAGDGVHAFVFNFVDQLIHGRAESSVLAEVARDEVALRALTRQWFERSALRALLTEAARRGVPTPPPTCATSSPRTCAPSAPSRRCCSPTRPRSACRPAPPATTRCWPPATASSCTPPGCASTRRAIAAPSCTAASRRRR